MAKLDMQSRVVHAALHRLPAILLIALLVFAAFCVATLLARHYQKHAGVGAVTAPGTPTAVYGDTLPAGRFTANLTYTSIAAPGNGEVTSPVAWDDGWFSRDPFEYNHELATTSSVLAALAYSESGYYQAGNTQSAYMENALAKLGFDKVSTASYRYRSEIVDEVLNLFTDESDAVAYTIARKHLQVADGAAPRDLILVSVRGSYGSEWLSNLKLMPEDANAEHPVEPLADVLTAWMSFVGTLTGQRAVEYATENTAAPQSDGTDDHGGYSRASEEICAELNRWIAASCDDGAEVAVLLTGHSRGGAIANLVAAELDDIATARPAQSPAVYAYTFASPATTLSDHAHNARYGNIFNIVNPADIMPYLPLQSWGYERYGSNLYLPAVDEDRFANAYEDMQRSYVRTVGVESGYDPDDKRVIDRVSAEVSQQVATVQDLMTPAGVAAVVASCASHIDPIRILHGHYPSTYIAWMDVLDADDLTCE